jgi:hypothetical protein
MRAKTSREKKRRGYEGTKREADKISLPSDELALRD